MMMKMMTIPLQNRPFVNALFNDENDDKNDESG